MAELERAQAFHEVKTPRSYLFYGPGGTGKTLLALKHPGRKLILDVDERAHDLIDLLTPEERKLITIWTPNVMLGHKDIQYTEVDPTRRDVYNKGTMIKSEPQGYRKWVTVVNELLHYQGEFPYDVVITDSLSRVVDHLTYLIMYTHKVSNMTQTLFGVMGRNLKEAVQGFLLLPCTRIVIAHELHSEKRDEATGAVIWEKIRPLVIGSASMREELSTLFSEVYHFVGAKPGGVEQGKVVYKYMMQTVNDRTSHARTAKKLDADQVIDPAKIFA